LGIPSFSLFATVFATFVQGERGEVSGLFGLGRAETIGKTATVRYSKNLEEAR
jgi:hypothetical protein